MRKNDIYIFNKVRQRLCVQQNTKLSKFCIMCTTKYKTFKVLSLVYTLKTENMFRVTKLV